jgi:hypothetical protein
VWRNTPLQTNQLKQKQQSVKKDIYLQTAPKQQMP